MGSKTVGCRASDARLGSRPGNAQLIQKRESPLSSFKMSAPGHSWKHFSEGSLGHKWGRASTWRECVSGHKKTDCIFSSWNTNLHTGTWLFLHLNDVSSFGGDSKVLPHGPGSYNCQKYAQHILTVCILTSTAKWSDKIFSIN